MKSITVVFEDAEHKKLVKTKGKMNWHNFIMKLVGDDN